MSTNESWPPVSSPPRERRPRVPRWLWIPAILALPAAGWGVYQGQDAEPSRAPDPDPHALHALAAQQPPASAKPVHPATRVAEPSTPAAKPAERGHGDEGRADVDDVDDEGSAEEDGAEDDGAEEDDNSVAKRASDSVASTADEGFWIQVASLPLKEKADRMAAQLRKRGHDAHSSAYGGPRAGWWHVVRIGPYDTRLDAERARLAFADQEAIPSEVQPRAHGPYYIKVASLRSEESAKSQAARLGRRGHHAVVRTVATKSGPWYCVRVGPFDFETDVLGYQKLLEEHDGVKGDITPRLEESPE